jgi:hypothetical protein
MLAGRAAIKGDSSIFSVLLRAELEQKVRSLLIGEWPIDWERLGGYGIRVF